MPAAGLPMPLYTSRDVAPVMVSAAVVRGANGSRSMTVRESGAGVRGCCCCCCCPCVTWGPRTVVRRSVGPPISVEFGSQDVVHGRRFRSGLLPARGCGWMPPLPVGGGRCSSGLRWLSLVSSINTPSASDARTAKSPTYPSGRPRRSGGPWWPGRHQGSGLCSRPSQHSRCGDARSCFLPTW